ISAGAPAAAAVGRHLFEGAARLWELQQSAGEGGEAILAGVPDAGGLYELEMYRPWQRSGWSSNGLFLFCEPRCLRLQSVAEFGGELGLRTPLWGGPAFSWRREQVRERRAGRLGSGGHSHGSHRAAIHPHDQQRSGEYGSRRAAADPARPRIA